MGGTLVAGGVFYDWIGYGNLDGITPYGPKSLLLRHTSVYGFALSGLFVGAGARMMHGGFIAHAYSETAKKSVKSALATIVILLAGILGATLATNNTVPFLTDGFNNPSWDLNHNVSGNISIAIGFLFLIIGFLMKRRDFNDT